MRGLFHFRGEHLKTKSCILIALLLTSVMTAAAQDVYVGCTDEALTRQQETFALYLTLDFANNRDMALANLFRLGAIYQSMALDCGYAPNQAESQCDARTGARTLRQ